MVSVKLGTKKKSTGRHLAADDHLAVAVQRPRLLVVQEGLRLDTPVLVQVQVQARVPVS